MKALVIDTKDLTKNIETIKSATNSKIIAVLKCDAYGLDIVQYADLLLKNGIDFFAVSSFEEALTLRSNGFDNNILLLSPVTDKKKAVILIENNIIATVADNVSAQVLSESAKELNTNAVAHLKVETGFGRFGMDADDCDKIVEFIGTYENISYQGMFSHFSFSFEKKNKYTKKQFEIFTSLIEQLKSKGIVFEMTHIANSSAFLKYPETHLDAVRIGSAFLGRVAVPNSLGLIKIAFLESSVEYIKELPKGHNIGYANTYKTKKNTRIGIVPVGYFDGFGIEKSKDTFRFIDILRYIFHDLKSFNRKTYVTINGKKISVLGRIGMYNTVVDITDTDISIGDTVKFNVNPILVNSCIKREYR